MEIEDYLAKLKSQIDAELGNFFELKIRQSKSENKPKELIEMIESLEKFTLNFGKRIRPILFYFGYISAGGKNKTEALKTSIAIELIHSYLLIHDDIIDRDDFRHGDFSMHYSYAKKAENDFKNIDRTFSSSPRWSLSSEDSSESRAFSSQSSAERLRLGKRSEEALADSKHFGISMAIIIGDLALSLGYKILNNSDFKEKLKRKALNNLDEIIYNTIFGQALDLTINKTEDFNVEKIFEMQKYKTAKYTIEGPLQLGAILAGADDKFLDSLSKYAVPAGIAFQIQDDIIGIFGDEKKIGKPVGSDIKEGKKTLLIAKAMENGSDAEIQVLNNTLGNENINDDDVEMVRDIIIKTGSLEFSKNKARELVKEAKESLNDLEISAENKKFLNDLADFVVQRKY